MPLKTRKQFRLMAEGAAAQLAEIQTPEGLARFMFSKAGDDVFEEAFRAEIEKLAKQARDEDVGDVEALAGEVSQIEEDQAAIEKALSDARSEAEQNPELGQPAPGRYRLMHLLPNDSAVPVLDAKARPVTKEEPFTKEEISTWALSNGVPETELRVDEHEAGCC